MENFKMFATRTGMSSVDYTVVAKGAWAEIKTLMREHAYTHCYIICPAGEYNVVYARSADRMHKFKV